MKTIKIQDCMVTQHGLRNEAQLASMIEFVKSGGRFNLESLEPPGPLIHIVRFEDGQLYIQDGHHRMCAMILAGRDFLYEDEYRLEDWMYYEFRDINFKCNWVTPYDPRKRTRHPDYSEYKEQVGNYLKVSRNHATVFIVRNQDLYSADRELDLISDLIDHLSLSS